MVNDNSTRQIYVEKLSLKSMGCVFEPLPESGYQLIATVRGIVDGFGSVTDTITNIEHKPAEGLFFGINTISLDMYNSTTLYLPGYAQESLPIDKPFAVDIFRVKAENMAGYRYEVRERVEK